MDNYFIDFIYRYENRKTVPKNEALNLSIAMVESCKYPLHYAACSLAGHEPAKLSEYDEAENAQIRKYNQHIEGIIKKMKESFEKAIKY